MAGKRPVEPFAPAAPAALQSQGGGGAEPFRCASGAHIVGRVSLKGIAIRAEVTTLLSRPLAVMADSVGEWGIDCLWRHDRPEASPRSTLRAMGLPRLAELVDRAFKLERVRYIRLFITQGHGFVRPHRDWTGSEPVFTRYHVPLITSDASLNSESSRIYRMDAGEIWYLDGSKPHSAISRGPDRRVHLVLDFDPLPTPDAAIRHPISNGGGPDIYKAKGELSTVQKAAIHALWALASGRNQVQIADALGALHFEYESSCEDVYDWLDTIASKSKDAAAVLRAGQLRSAYLGKPS